MEHVGDPGQLTDPGGVSQEVPDGHRRPAGRRLDLEGLEVLVDRVVEPEAAGLVQL
jgi:hypothetical protein